MEGQCAHEGSADALEPLHLGQGDVDAQRRIEVLATHTRALEDALA